MIGLIKFIIGVLGILLIIGTGSAFLPLILLGGFVSGSVTTAFALPIVLLVIGAVMVYFGFYYHGSISSNKSNQFLKWGIIHSISLYVGLIIIQKIGINNLFIKFILLGVFLSIVASIINKVHVTKKRQLLSYMLHIFAVWLSIQYLINLIGINNYLASVIFTGFFVHIFFVIFQKLKLRGKEIPITILLLFIFIVFNISSLSSISLSDIEFSNFNFNQEEIINISEECEARVFQVIGDTFTINYEYGETSTDHGWRSFYVEFPNQKEGFDSTYGYKSTFMGRTNYKPSGTTNLNNKKLSYRLGTNVGENKRWLYGGASYQYSYSRKDIVDNQGIIIGDNYFIIKIKIDDLSQLYPVFYKQSSTMYVSDKLSIPSNSVVTVTKCEFVN